MVMDRLRLPCWAVARRNRRLSWPRGVGMGHRSDFFLTTACRLFERCSPAIFRATNLLWPMPRRTEQSSNLAVFWVGTHCSILLGMVVDGLATDAGHIFIMLMCPAKTCYAQFLQSIRETIKHVPVILNQIKSTCKGRFKLGLMGSERIHLIW